MKKYKTSAELKALAKEQLFGSYGTVIGALVIVMGFQMLTSFLPAFLIVIDSIATLIIYFLVTFLLRLISGIFSSGQAFLYLKLVCGQRVSVGDVFYGFRFHADKALFIQLVFTLVSYVCTVPVSALNHLFSKTQDVRFLFLISVTTIVSSAVIIFVNLLFSQVYYLLQDFPDYSTGQLLKMSCHIMKGHKGRLFYLQLSFIPLFLLGILSCCIAFLWIVPYMKTTLTDFYMDLMTDRQEDQA